MIAVSSSDVFAKTAAGVFAANGIKVYIWPRLLPVPTVTKIHKKTQVKTDHAHLMDN